MPDDSDQSLYRIVAARRSRSERLSALAREHGLEESGATSERDDAEDVSAMAGDGEVERAKPETGFEPDSESPGEGAEASAASKEAIANEDASGAGEGLLAVEEELVSGDEAEEGFGEDEALEPEELIAGSDSLLSDEPAPIDEAETRTQAEALADRIGPIVDIQSLPKTKPSRVLSKTAKAVEEAKTAKPEAGSSSPSLPPQALASVQGLIEGAPEGASMTDEGSEVGKAKKKKRISLLDSYFKGL